MERNIRIGITQGDFNGIGPEVVLKSLANEMITDLFTPVVFIDQRIMQQAIRQLHIEMPRYKVVEKAVDARAGVINIVDLKLNDITLTPGKPDAISGQGALESLEAAVTALTEGTIDALVTAPISKEAIQSDKFKFPGHTEYLNSKAGDSFKSQMILFDDMLRVALVTTHVPVSKISEVLTTDAVADSIKSFAATLRKDFAITAPKIAVLSLNPHTGDGGLLGHEEKEVITPAINACSAENILAFGPFAADGFFGSGAWRNYDGVLAMYHDQGLAPFKAIAGDKGVNFTAGLPWVRTSPDHGTANDIAWKGEADAQSMREAVYKAVDIYRRRKNHLEASANPLEKYVSERPQRGERQQRTENKNTEE